MILQNISKNLRSQNWVGVTIELMIVALGVFMGLQVQEWNEERKELIEENQLYERLYDETRELREAHRQELADRKAKSDDLIGINPVLFSLEPARALSNNECFGVLASHVNRRPPDELPVLDEMLRTGDFGKLRDQELKKALRKYLLLREQARSHYVETRNELFRLHSRFPDLIKLRLVVDKHNSRSLGLSGEGFSWTRECDVEKMRDNAAFLNEYVDNLARINSITQFIEDRDEKLKDLQAALRDKLGVLDNSQPGE